MDSRTRRRRVGHALVAAQLGLVAGCLIPAGPALWSGLRTAGVIVLAGGAALGVLAVVAMGRDTRVHPVPGEGIDLHTSGVYALVRHPMYVAVLLACSGLTLVSGRALAVACLMALGVVLHLKSRFEDRLLFERFGWQFAVYASHVPALVPQPWRLRRR